MKATQKISLENQETITKWARETFGPLKSQEVALQRMFKEMDELATVDVRGKDSFEQVSNECADILITMYCVADVFGFDLHACVDHKMQINRGRKWALNENRTAQHIEE